MHTTALLLAISGLAAAAPSGSNSNRRYGWKGYSGQSNALSSLGYSFTSPASFPHGTGYAAPTGLLPSSGLASSSNGPAVTSAPFANYGSSPIDENAEQAVGTSTLISMLTVPYPASTSASMYGVAAASSTTKAKCGGSRRTTSQKAVTVTSATTAPQAPEVAYTTPSAAVTPIATSASSGNAESSIPSVEYAAPSSASSLSSTPYSAPVSSQQPEVTASLTSTSTAAPAEPTSSTPGTSGQPSLDSSIVDGKATFYGGNISGGTCSFTEYTLPSGLFGVAYPTPDWDNAGNCGACIEVTGPNGKTITAMIVDSCPSCEKGHLDLFSDAFSQLSDPSAGIIDVSYKFVTCGITSPITLHNKSGVSAYWFSMQVVNANEPVKSLEVSTDGGATWEATERQEYNFFERSSGFGASEVDIRVTSETGKVLTVKNVKVEDDGRTTCESNF
ncbi:hypothetical protein BROUX41_002428 [Berkeleyomyces rouxiae]|uniref:uncharacterized protein n=1 Tax=Berkeleyomyces rouxiae TaxID=2035830 RepID=UPI003B7A49D8